MDRLRLGPTSEARGAGAHRHDGPACAGRGVQPPEPLGLGIYALCRWHGPHDDPPPGANLRGYRGLLERSGKRGLAGDRRDGRYRCCPRMGSPV